MASGERYDAQFRAVIEHIRVTYHRTYSGAVPSEQSDRFLNRLEELTLLYESGAYGDAFALVKRQEKHFGRLEDSLMEEGFSGLGVIIRNRNISESLRGNSFAKKPSDEQP
ncbi:hypothetical protein JXA12_00015 [Candidatus Woesearchaeota archaeon]|nr:hypothetical protein [Candidatus Woesearchaeota archaeon]